MTRTTTKVIYKPDSQSTDEFIVIVGDVDALTKWRDGVRRSMRTDRR